jgi:mRNA interferase RelE/StbE
VPSRYEIVLRPAARRSLNRLPEDVATAIFEFMAGPLTENPERVGKRLRPPRDNQYSARRGQYRVIYEILEQVRVVAVLQVGHRRNVYC